MKNLTLASLSLAAAVVLGASQANATLVQATAQDIFTGALAPRDSFNFNYYCFSVANCSQSGADSVLVVGPRTLAGSVADFTFDTNLGVISHGLNNSETLTWNSGMGTPSPLLSGTFSVSGIFNYVQDLSGATSFTITRSSAGLSFVISGVDYRFAAGRVDNTAVPDGSVYSLAAAYNPAFYQFGFQSQETVRNGAQLLGSQYQQVATLTPLGVPEPSTWGLLLAGFAGIGAALRNARRQSAPRLA